MNNIFHKFADAVINKVARRDPDVMIGGSADPYLLRWYVIPRNRFFNIYLHCFLRSDDDRALHTHPWVNISILLRGAYTEHTQSGMFLRKSGDIVLRASGDIAHRIELTYGNCWSLFITGPRYKEWGFLCPQGFVHWKDFTAPDNPHQTGPGCDQ